MTYQTEREDFLIRCASEGLPVNVGRQLLSAASTLQRLAVAQCNGDYPADNGERKTRACPQCEGLWATAVMLGGRLCPDCRAEARVLRLLHPFPGWGARFHGDPRGAILRLHTPKHTDEGWGGLAVPARER